MTRVNENPHFMNHMQPNKKKEYLTPRLTFSTPERSFETGPEKFYNDDVALQWSAFLIGCNLKPRTTNQRCYTGLPIPPLSLSHPVSSIELAPKLFACTLRNVYHHYLHLELCCPVFFLSEGERDSVNENRKKATLSMWREQSETILCRINWEFLNATSTPMRLKNWPH